MKRKKASLGGNKILWISSVIVIVFILFLTIGSSFSSVSEEKVTYYDTDITDFKWTGCWDIDDICYSSPIHFDYEKLKGEGDLIINSNKEKLYALIYVNGKMSSATQDFPKFLNGGINRVHLTDIELDSLYDKFDMEICFSTKRDFTKYSEGIICKSESFSLPRISVKVSPDPVRFTIEKEGIETPRKNIKITNTGKIPIIVNVLLPSYIVEDLDHPKYYPQYPTFGFVEYPDHFPNPSKEKSGMPVYINLLPGESTEYDIGVSVGNIGEFDTPLGAYTSTGYVYTFPASSFNKAQFKEEFTIITNVE